MQTLVVPKGTQFVRARNPEFANENGTAAPYLFFTTRENLHILAWFRWLHRADRIATNMKLTFDTFECVRDIQLFHMHADVGYEHLESALRTDITESSPRLMRHTPGTIPDGDNTLLIPYLQNFTSDGWFDSVASNSFCDELLILTRCLCHVTSTETDTDTIFAPA